MRWSTAWTVLSLVGTIALSAAYPALPELRFDRVSLQEGLSQASVYAIAQDRQGFLWVGGGYGLNRYDGYGFQLLTHNPEDPGSLASNEVRVIFEDSKGNLWVGTLDAGLCRWDPARRVFVRYRHDPQDPTSLSHDSVHAIIEHPPGTLWLATSGGLDRLDRDGAEVTRYRHDPAEPTTLSDNHIAAIASGTDDRLWVGTGTGGVCHLDPHTGRSRRFRHDPGDRDSVASDSIDCLLAEGDGTLWVGTVADGLDRMDPESGRCVHYRHDPDDPTTLPSNYVSSVFRDSRGSLWVGTGDRGLARLDRGTGLVERFPVDPDDPSALSSPGVQTLIEDRSEILWIGTDFGGLNKVDLKGRSFQTLRRGLPSKVVFAVLEDSLGNLWIGTTRGLARKDPVSGETSRIRSRPGDPTALQSDPIYALVEDREGAVWVGSWLGGLARFDRVSGRFRTFKHDPADPHSLSHDTIFALLEGDSGELWVGTFGGGLDRFDPRTGRFSHYRHRPEDSTSLGSNFVRALHKDQAGRLWVGTIGGGLNQLDRETGRFTRHTNRPGDPTSLSDDRVACIFEDASGTLWVGTAGGLNRLDSESGRFARYGRREGLPNDAITGILQDSAGKLWMAHFGGLSRFDPGSGEMRSFQLSDGLENGEFNSGAYFRSRSGEMHFGGVDGLTSFHAERIGHNPHPPAVVVTSVSVYGQVLATDEPIGELRLDHHQDFLSFEFVALEFTSPERNSYAYRLEGLESDWVYCGSRRFASYANLSPGSYAFRVKAANGDGLWNETGARLAIEISPPFWQTWWFNVAAGIACALALAALYSWRTRFLRHKLTQQQHVEQLIRDSRDRLQEAYGELQRYSTQLESMVAERTSQLRDANQELMALASRDSLTGAANRRRFADAMDEEWRRAGRSRTPLSLLMVDIDNFKSFNDTYGHRAGDECLQRVVAAVQTEARRPGDLVARYGGEEFAVILPGSATEGAHDLAERVRAAVERLDIPHGGSRPGSVVTVSVGGATAVPGARDDWSDLVGAADEALYHAKRGGKNRVEWRPMTDPHVGPADSRS